MILLVAGRLLCFTWENLFCGSTLYPTEYYLSPAATIHTPWSLFISPGIFLSAITIHHRRYYSLSGLLFIAECYYSPPKITIHYWSLFIRRGHIFNKLASFDQTFKVVNYNRLCRRCGAKHSKR